MKTALPDTGTKPEKVIFAGHWTLHAWCRFFNCDERDLMNAMQVMGNSVQAIDDYLILNRLKKA